MMDVLLRIRARLFWKHFLALHQHLSAEQPSDNSIAELDRAVARLGPFDWEIGPGKVAGTYLALSPRRSPENLQKTRSVVGRAPNLSGWEFLAAKPPKQDWRGVFVLDGTEVDTGGWSYVMYKYPGDKLELHVKAPNLAGSPVDGETAVSIGTELALGEESCMRIADISLVNDFGEHAEQASTFRHLPVHFAEITARG